VSELDDVVFAWAIGKALLILIVSFGTLVYAAWAAVTWQEKNAAQFGIPNDSALKYAISVKAGKVSFIAIGITEEAEGTRRIFVRTSGEEMNIHKPEQPAAAA
jgi:hypothetical protein